MSYRRRPGSGIEVENSEATNPGRRADGKKYGTMNDVPGAEPVAGGPDFFCPSSSELDSMVVGGLNAVLAALKTRPKSGRTLMVAEGRRPVPTLTEIFDLARAAGLTVKIVPRRALDRVYDSSGHQGVVALFDARNYLGLDEFLESLSVHGPALVLALDQVADPGNLGALMRSARAFGALGLLAPRDRTAPLTTAAIKASAGAAESLPLVRVVNLRRALESMQKMGFWLVGAEGEGGQNLFDFSFPERAVLVLGSEGRGLSPLIKKICDFRLTIPQHREHVSSLNVSVAGGILMAEYFRQHQ